MKIENIGIADFCEDGTTVSVAALDSGGNKETFHVQTVDGCFRSDLGCWMLTDSSGGDIDPEDYPTFDLDETIEKAEAFIQSQVQEECTGYRIDSKEVYLLISSENVKVVTRNDRFINADTSSYQREFSEPLETFGDRGDAIAYLETNN